MCLNADDMRLVGSAYAFLKDTVLEGPRDVTPTILKSSTGLEVSKLSPKKWGLSGSSRFVLVIFLGGVSFLLSQGIDVRLNLALILGLAALDSIFLGGSCLAQISSYWPPNKCRILVHEGGHLLIGNAMIPAPILVVGRLNTAPVNEAPLCFMLVFFSIIVMAV